MELSTYDNRRDEGCDARLRDPFCDELEAIAVCFVVALVNRKVETKSTIDLNVNVPWTGEVGVSGDSNMCRVRRSPEDVAGKVDDLVWPAPLLIKSCLRFVGSESKLSNHKSRTHLGVQNDPTTLVDPKILLGQAAVLSRQKAVGEADQTVGRRRHGHSLGERPVSLIVRQISKHMATCRT